MSDEPRLPSLKKTAGATPAVSPVVPKPAPEVKPAPLEGKPLAVGELDPILMAAVESQPVIAIPAQVDPPKKAPKVVPEFKPSERPKAAGASWKSYLLLLGAGVGTMALAAFGARAVLNPSGGGAQNVGIPEPTTTAPTGTRSLI